MVPSRPVVDQLLRVRQGRCPSVGEAAHRVDARGRRLTRPRPPSAPPPRRCSPAASRRARACRPRSAAIAISACSSPGCRCRSGRCRRARPARRQSVSVAANPNRSAAAPTASAFRPATAVSSSASGRSKNRGAFRHAWAWAAPMKAYPIMPTRSDCRSSDLSLQVTRPGSPGRALPIDLVHRRPRRQRRASSGRCSAAERLPVRVVEQVAERDPLPGLGRADRRPRPWPGSSRCCAPRPDGTLAVARARRRTRPANRRSPPDRCRPAAADRRAVGGLRDRCVVAVPESRCHQLR